ncbi:MAG: biopolymer transporter ExbD [Planctomycetaceae bacterium]
MKRRRTTFGIEDESGFAAPKRVEQAADLDITPMIDVTFLLLIFFMVTSTMQGTPDLDVPPARYGTGTPLRNSIVVRVIAAGVGGSDRHIIQIPKTDPDGNDATIRDANFDEVTREVSDAVAAGRVNAIVKADREVPHGFVQQVVRAVTAVEGAKFTIGVRDQLDR